jgi:hypothetical protein
LKYSNPICESIEEWQKNTFVVCFEGLIAASGFVWVAMGMKNGVIVGVGKRDGLSEGGRGLLFQIALERFLSILLMLWVSLTCNWIMRKLPLYIPCLTFIWRKRFHVPHSNFSSHIFIQYIFLKISYNYGNILPLFSH